MAQLHERQSRSFTTAALLRCTKWAQSIIRKEHAFDISSPLMLPAALNNVGIDVDNADLAKCPHERHSVANAAALTALMLLSMHRDLNALPTNNTPLAKLNAYLRDLCSRLVWGVDKLRSMQREALQRIFDEKNRKQAIVQPTGNGKSHIIKVTVISLKGVYLIIHPLLMLTADQAPNFRGGGGRVRGNGGSKPRRAYNNAYFASSCHHQLDCQPQHGHNFNCVSICVAIVSCSP